MKYKNKLIVIIGILLILSLLMSLSYAYWLISKKQSGNNVVTTKCLDITMSNEQNDITLTNQYPISDEEGMKLVPYEFTITNNCNTSVDYQVALEILGEENNKINLSSIKISFNDKIELLEAKKDVAPTIEEAYNSKLLNFARLSPKGSEGSSDSYKLKLWIDKSAPIEEINKTFISKISVTIGQGIENPYGEDSLAYDILARYGGSGKTKQLSTKYYETNKDTAEEREISVNYTYYWGDNISFDPDNGYTLSGNVVGASVRECRNGITDNGKKEINCGKYYIPLASSNYHSNNYSEVINLNTSSGGMIVKTYEASNEFADNKDITINKTEDDTGWSYYYQGNVTDNYVQFGKNVYYDGDFERLKFGLDSKKYLDYDECKAYWDWDYGEEVVKRYNNCEKIESPAYWRIVRINGDGSIRLIYDGDNLYENGVNHETSIGEEIPYGQARKQLESWYKLSLYDEYEQYIEDQIFCNDSRISHVVYKDEWFSIVEETEVEYPRKNEYFSSVFRSNKPSLKCNKEDRYTANNVEIGNGKFNYPVGLLTADDAVLAKSRDSYLVSGERSWIMTPGIVDAIYGKTMYMLMEDGFLSYTAYLDQYLGNVRPVINLKANVKFTGSGTIDDPYVIITE